MKQLRHLSSILNIQNTIIAIMTVLTGVKITSEQKQFLDEKAINFSKFVRNAIDREMEK